MPKATPLGAYRAQVGEGAWWDQTRQVLWSVDIFAPAVVRTDLAGVQKLWPMPEMAAGVATSADGKLIVAMETGLFSLEPEGTGKTERLAAPDDLPPTHRFNDLTIDAAGNLIVGTMRKSSLGPAPTGKLYAYDGSDWRVLVDGLTTVNGVACAPDGTTLYWADSAPDVNRIWRATYDPAQRELGPPALFCDMSKERGRPDGAAMDADGGYWIAAVGGGCLHRFGAGGVIESTIDLPADHPTKPAFGGPGLQTLFVTTLSIRESRPEARAAAGAILSLDAPVRGFCPPSFGSTSRRTWTVRGLIQ